MYVCDVCVHAVNEIMRGGAIHTHKRNLLIVLNCEWAWMAVAQTGKRTPQIPANYLSTFLPNEILLAAEAANIVALTVTHTIYKQSSMSMQFVWIDDS